MCKLHPCLNFDGKIKSDCPVALKGFLGCGKTPWMAISRLLDELIDEFNAKHFKLLVIETQNEIDLLKSLREENGE